MPGGLWQTFKFFGGWLLRGSTTWLSTSFSSCTNWPTCLLNRRGFGVLCVIRGHQNLFWVSQIPIGARSRSSSSYVAIILSLPLGRQQASFMAFVDPGGFPPPMVHLPFFFYIAIDGLLRIYPMNFFLFSFSPSFPIQVFKTSFIGHRISEGKGCEISWPSISLYFSTVVFGSWTQRWGQEGHQGIQPKWVTFFLGF